VTAACRVEAQTVRLACNLVKETCSRIERETLSGDRELSRVGSVRTRSDADASKHTQERCRASRRCVRRGKYRSMQKLNGQENLQLMCRYEMSFEV